MDSDKLSVEEMVEYYKPDVEELAVYIPWLETHKGGESSSVFTGEGVEKNSITFPVYDTTLMNFVKQPDEPQLCVCIFQKPDTD